MCINNFLNPTLTNVVFLLFSFGTVYLIRQVFMLCENAMEMSEKLALLG